MSSSQVYHKILKEINDMPEKELLKQNGYYNLLDSIAMSMLKKGERPIHLSCSSTDSMDTGCTDGSVIMINTWSPIVLSVEKMDEFIKNGKKPNWASVLPEKYNVRHLMYLCNVGTVAHEFGHVMYTDFKLLNEIREKAYNGKFKGCASEEKLAKLYNMPQFKDIVVRNIFDLINIIEDCYIENCLCLEYPKQGNVVRGLETGNLMKFFMSSSITSLEERIVKGKALLSDAFLWMLQIKNCLGYTPKNYEKASGQVHEILDEALKKADSYCQSYKISSLNHENEIYNLIDILASLYPDPDIMQALANANGKGEGEGEGEKGEGESDENQSNQSNGQDNNVQSKGNGKNQNQQSQGGNGNSQDSQSQDDDGDGSSDDQNQKGKSEDGTEETKEDEGDGKGEDDKKSKEDIINGQKGNSETEKTSKDLKKDSGQSSDERFSQSHNKARRDPSRTASEADQKEADEAKELAKANNTQDEDISKELAKEAADEQKSASQSEELQKQYNTLEEKGDLIRGSCCSTDVRRIKADDSIYSKDEYDEYYRKIEKTAKSCVRKVGQILEKREFDEEENGFVQGFKFNAHEAYRRDKKVFSRELVPDSKPDVAFTIMIDESGSMSGRKNEKAIETAILFDEISRKLDIPTQIVGHTAYFGPIVKVYRNFDSNEKEKYALTNIDASGGNVDTVVLSGLCEQMLSRPEDKKVVIVISDGEPCRYSEETRTEFGGVPFKDLNDYEREELNACVRYYRKKGVKIIGIAIDSAKKIKDIYEDGFLDCTSLNKLPVEMVKIFKRYVLK